MGDRTKPSAELALSAEPFESEVNPCPDVLKDVFGVGGVEGHVEDVNEQPVRMFGDQTFEGLGVSGLDAIDQQGVFAPSSAGIGLGGRSRHNRNANTVERGGAKMFAGGRIFRCG